MLDSTVLTAVGSRWRPVADASAANGTALENPDLGQAKITQALAAPASYVEATFRAAAGVPYRVWIRMRAAGDSYWNDSIYAQFSGTVTSAGAATTRIGSTGAVAVVLEDGSGAGVPGWGWADGGYGTLGARLYFNGDGLQTIRIQQREDGVRIDQIVISAADFFAAAPGSVSGDSTIVPLFDADATGIVVGHAYRVGGVFPVTLSLKAGSASATDSTTATIK